MQKNCTESITDVCIAFIEKRITLKQLKEFINNHQEEEVSVKEIIPHVNSIIKPNSKKTIDQDVTNDTPKEESVKEIIPNANDLIMENNENCNSGFGKDVKIAMEIVLSNFNEYIIDQGYEKFTLYSMVLPTNIDTKHYYKNLYKHVVKRTKYLFEPKGYIIKYKYIYQGYCKIAVIKLKLPL